MHASSDDQGGCHEHDEAAAEGPGDHADDLPGYHADR